MDRHHVRLGGHAAAYAGSVDDQGFTRFVTDEASVARGLVLLVTGDAEATDRIADAAWVDVHRRWPSIAVSANLRARGLAPFVTRAIQDADEALGGIIVNVAHQLHEKGAELAEVREYALHWSLKPPEIVDRMLAFAGDPIWRTYVSTYSDGHRLCRAFVAGDDERFARLLVEQLTPADLLNSEIGRSLA